MYSLVSDTENSGIKVYTPGDAFGFYNGQTYLSFDDVEGQSWFQALINGFDASFSPFIICPVGSLPENNPANAAPGKRFEQVVAFARIVKSPENYHECIGVVRIDLRASYLSRILDQNNLYNSYASYVETTAGELILAGQRSDPQAFRGFLPVVSDTQGRWLPVTVEGERWLLRKEPIGKYDAVLVNVIPEAEIFAQLSPVRQTAMAATPAVAFLSLLLAFLVDDFISRRTRTLADAMRSVQTGRLCRAPEGMGQDEIGVLAANYNYMIDEMQKLVRAIYRSGQELKGAELRLLQAQINPHFLYNTLDMIGYFALQNRTEEAQDAIAALVRFYRVTLSKGRDLVTLREELQHVYYYVLLENMRHGGGLLLEEEVPEELKDCRIPKTTLQPLVENAILHGILCRQEKQGRIRITARREGGDVIVAVSDDGAGMEADKAAGMLSSGENGRENGYGVKNVHARLRICYGEGYGLRYQSTVGEGTTVEIRMANPLPNTTIDKPAGNGYPEQEST